MRIWDTSGEARYRSLAGRIFKELSDTSGMYYQDADIALLTYDTTNAEESDSQN